MFADNWVTRDELYATGATFTVVAWGFAYLYLAIQFIWPELVHDLRRGRPGHAHLVRAALPLDHDDDLDRPVRHPRRRRRTPASFVLLQQIAGMLYVALVVARLVGLTIARFRQ